MSGLGHTWVHPGKRVVVFLRDGTTIVGKFLDRNKRSIFLDVDGEKVEVTKTALRRMTILKRDRPL